MATAKIYSNNPRLVSSWFILWLIAFYLTGCSNTGTIVGKSSKQPGASTSQPSHTNKRGGGYYLDDGPETNPPIHLDAVVNAIPKAEPLRSANMKRYSALGKTYVPMTKLVPYRTRGTASWYGKRFHGKNTASGEIYNMYAMTAAHPTLPIPSYVRVTHLQNGKSIIVRVNDRGPFIDNRLIDLSYVAAHKLDMLADGSAPVEVEIILPHQSSANRATPPQTLPASTVMHSDDNEATYLQVAAFSASENAQNYFDRFQSQLQTEFQDIAHLSRIRETNGLYRVLIGPFTDEKSARQIASVLLDSIGTQPILLK
ncbi:MAG TPA: septal ring lytic transglycosylase RlpA family protein [Nitrosomonas mobilis]|nr:septal ring lytic transglycosylase RlpA family protein [Nitrosomonas mobilis]